MPRRLLSLMTFVLLLLYLALFSVQLKEVAKAFHTRAMEKPVTSDLTLFKGSWLTISSSQNYTLGGDFTVYWCASDLIKKGTPEAVYHESSRKEALLKYLKGADGLYFFYSPAYLLLLSPLAYLPLWPAYVAWILAGTAAYLAAVRKALNDRLAMQLALTFPGFFWSVLTGQNGLFTGALLIGSLWLLEANPFLAGACAGLLYLKPQLAVGLGIAFLAGRHWKALASSLVVFFGLTALSALLLGIKTWEAYFAEVNFFKIWLMVENGVPSWWKIMCSAEVALLWYGVPTLIARSVQIGLGLFGAAAIFKVFWQSKDIKKRAFVLTGATLLFSPYLYIYDLICLSAPLCALGITIKEGRATRAEMALAFILFFTPLLLVFGEAFSLQPFLPPVTPLLAITLLILGLRK